MNAPEWVEYDGSEGEIEEIKSASNGVIFEYVGSFGIDTSVFKYAKDKYHIDNRLENKAIAKYLICQPHQYADLIKIWADTGCQVWVRPTKPYAFEVSDYENHPTTKLMVDHRGVYLITTAPDWNIPGEYRLSPFED